MISKTRFLLLSLLVSSPLAAVLPPQNISHIIAQAVKVDSPPLIDAQMDAVWETAPQYTISNYIPFGDSSTPPDNAADISATWRALWDAEHLYLYFDVLDDTHPFIEHSTLEVFASTNYSRMYGGWGPGYDGSSDVHMRVLLDSQTAVHGIYSYAFPASFAGVIFSLQSNPTGYSAELAITWDSLGINHFGALVSWYPDEGVFRGGSPEFREGLYDNPLRGFIGFEAQLQDNDTVGGPRETRMAWFGGPEDFFGDYAWAHTYAWGTLQLVYPQDKSFLGLVSGANQFIRLDSGFLWSSQSGYLYDGAWPYLYDYSSAEWLYVFPLSGNEADGYFLYNFSEAKFGYTALEYYPNYYLFGANEWRSF